MTVPVEMYDGLPAEAKQAVELERILMPNSRVKRDKLYGFDPATMEPTKSPRFVHYTSAEAALSIIRDRRLWMRNTNCMSDYREVQHGFDILREYFSPNETRANSFQNCINRLGEQIYEEALHLFNAWWDDTQLGTFIASISEHDESEDRHGRLSMWRAFGGSSARVALVFTLPWYSGAVQAMGCMFSPVTYSDKTEKYAELDLVLKNIENNCDYLRRLDRTVLVGWLYATFLSGVVSVKHEGFLEEREWRVIYSPKKNPSDLVIRSTEIVNGIPQIIYKLPLDASVSNEVAGLDFVRIFDRLIIGPSPYHQAIKGAFVGALTEIGVEGAQSRVVASQIPIRP